MGGAWTTADYALIVGLVSLCISIASFSWNVWSKFIYPKPKVRVTLHSRLAVGDGADGIPMAIAIGIVNYGPNHVTIKGISFVLFKRNKNRDHLHGVPAFYKNWPYSIETEWGGSEFPIRLEPGDECLVHMPESSLDYDVKDLFAYDSFDRKHFARRKIVKRFSEAAKARLASGS